MLKIADQLLTSRLLLGTAKYPSLEMMQQAIKAAEAEIITVSLRRQAANIAAGKTFWDYIKNLGCHILPNTAGCYSVTEAITTAQMARELFNTNWIKLEVIGDEYNLQPDPFGLLEATKELIQQGFEVLPYCTDDLVLCQKLVDAGCKVLMPWGSPIGSGQGLLNPFALKTIRARLPEITLIVDAGIGTPSHAVQAMELGCDAILLNSAVALAQNPIQMATAFNYAIKAGRLAYEAGAMQSRNIAQPTTPILNKPFWHQEKIS